MAAKICALAALLALLVSASTAVVIPHCSSPLGAATVTTIPQYFPSVTTLGSAHSFVQSYRQHQAFVAGISPLSAAFLQLPYQYNQLAISQLPYLYNQLANSQLPYYNQLAISQLPYLYNQLAIPQLPYLFNQLPYQYNQLAIPQLSNLYNQLAVANPAAFLPFSQFVAVRNPAALYQQPIIGGAFF